MQITVGRGTLMVEVPKRVLDQPNGWFSRLGGKKASCFRLMLEGYNDKKWH